MEFRRNSWKTFERGIEKEWILTNGIGGFSSSTIVGANTRRYHGLLVASLKSPVSRHLIVSKIDESIALNGETHNIYSFQTPDYTMEGFRYQRKFTMDPIPTFSYSVHDITIEKQVCTVYGENTVAVVYRIKNGPEPMTMRLSPLINFRDHHFNASREYMNFKQHECDDQVKIKPYDLNIDINIFCSNSRYMRQDNCYFYNMDYAVERERGLKSTEDHFIPGYFEVSLGINEERTVTLIASIEKEIKEKDGLAIIKKEKERLKSLVDRAGISDPLLKRLVIAADNFIVHRESTDSKTIIAGYPWFTDWGRDTMIALPGLTLATKRFEDAKDILYTFSRYVKYGLVPNVFPDGGDEPPYNTVDASLWYFEAVNKYVNYTKDYEFISEKIFDALTQIIEAYRNGTIFDIKMDKDSLITAGNERTQLTWMDAKVGDWVVTPRHGKAVEINALWYNALKVYGELAKRFGKNYSLYEDLAEEVKASFKDAFWNEEKECLYDVITGDKRDGSVRPNQIIAVSLSNPVLEGDMAKKVVNIVLKELYTPYGLKTLSSDDKQYAGIYIGNQYHRDGAYHQGTVWTWPLGHFITAFVRANGNTKEAKEKALRFIDPFYDHLEDACLGSISEIFDGNEPHYPRGCFAQAWSVGEILRAYVEDVL